MGEPVRADFAARFGRRSVEWIAVASAGLDAGSDALIALGDDEAARKRRIGEWHDQLLARDCAMDVIESDLRNRLWALSGSARSALEDELTYLDNNKDRMRYAGLARRGLPLGSGVTESAAKTVINQRAKGAGQRWKEVTRARTA